MKRLNCAERHHKIGIVVELRKIPLADKIDRVWQS